MDPERTPRVTTLKLGEPVSPDCKHPLKLITLENLQLTGDSEVTGRTHAGPWAVRPVRAPTMSNSRLENLKIMLEPQAAELSVPRLGLCYPKNSIMDGGRE